jgi:hypothetical protein
MRFYASEDCGARITYTLNTQPIGSIITQAGAPVISVNSITSSAVTSIAVMAGVPGSGTAATQVASGTGSTLTFTDNTLANLSQKYYYLDITEADGSRIVTAPIWYTRNDAALRQPGTPITSFFTINEADRVILKWTTAYETLHDAFEVERSTDGGLSFSRIGAFRGKGPNRAMLTYADEDLQPFNGIAHYRLIQRDGNGTVRFADIKTVNRTKEAAAFFTTFPNPVQDLLNVRIAAIKDEKTTIELFDMAGRMVHTQNISLAAGEQTAAVNMSRLTRGAYMLKLRLNGIVSSRLINKL